MADIDIVERLRAFSKANYGPLGSVPERDLMDEAASLIERLRAGRPEGWQLVPVEPTAEMIEAAVKGSRADVSYFDAEETYRAMLAASPPAPSPASPAESGPTIEYVLRVSASPPDAAARDEFFGALVDALRGQASLWRDGSKWMPNGSISDAGRGLTGTWRLTDHSPDGPTPAEGA